MQFRQAMAAVGGNQPSGSAVVSGGMARQMEDLDDRISCQWCNRKFAEEAGKRHFPHCEQKFKAN